MCSIISSLNADNADGIHNEDSDSEHQKRGVDKIDKENVNDLYERFETFNFRDDINFQFGLSKIMASRDGNEDSKIIVNIDRIKGFYYSSNIESFDWDAYLLWKREQSQRHDLILDNNKVCLEGTQASPDTNFNAISGFLSDQTTVVEATEISQVNSKDSLFSSSTHFVEPDCAECNSLMDKATTDRHTFEEGVGGADDKKSDNCDKTLSFQELVNLIQNGKSIPGLQQFDVEPTNQPPTPSQRTRIKKPWEE